MLPCTRISIKMNIVRKILQMNFPCTTLVLVLVCLRTFKELDNFK